MPWWATDKYLIHKVADTDFGDVRLYAQYEDRSWVYAYVERRSGTFYLFGLYRNGQCLPLYDQLTYRKGREECFKER